MLFRRRRDAGTAVVDRGSREDAIELLDEIDGLVERNRLDPDADLDREILRLRHRAGALLVQSAGEPPQYPEPAPVPASANGSALVEVTPDELSAEVLRAAMLSCGCLVIRGLVPAGEATRLVDEIEKAFAAREALGEGGSDPDGYWHLFEPDPPFEYTERDWVSSTGSIVAADSPRLMFEMLEAFERVGLRKVIAGYLGERPAISINKCTLRKVDASAGTAWHQDGAFLGDGVRALNVWVSLSDCGVDAPGLDVVPRRLDHIVPTGTEGAIFDWSVSDAIAQEAAGDRPIERPVFAPGDVVLFDDLFLHRTAVEPGMPNTRYAIESWFFGPTGFPGAYVPVGF